VSHSLFDALQRHVGKETLGWVVEGAVAYGVALELAYPETKAPSVHRLSPASIVRPLPESGEGQNQFPLLRDVPADHWPDIASAIALGKRVSKSRMLTHSGLTLMRVMCEDI
jgi:hypothetical protein